MKELVVRPCSASYTVVAAGKVGLVANHSAAIVHAVALKFCVVERDLQAENLVNDLARHLIRSELLNRVRETSRARANAV